MMRGSESLSLVLLAQIMKEDDRNWPEPDKVGCQELEVRRNGEEISFATTKLGNLLQVQQSKDPEGLRIFYYLVQVRFLLQMPLLSFSLKMPQLHLGAPFEALSHSLCNVMPLSWCQPSFPLPQSPSFDLFLCTRKNPNQKHQQKPKYGGVIYNPLTVVYCCNVIIANNVLELQT